MDVMKLIVEKCKDGGLSDNVRILSQSLYRYIPLLRRSIIHRTDIGLVAAIVYVASLHGKEPQRLADIAKLFNIPEESLKEKIKIVSTMFGFEYEKIVV